MGMSYCNSPNTCQVAYQFRNPAATTWRIADAQRAVVMGLFVQISNVVRQAHLFPFFAASLLLSLTRFAPPREDAEFPCDMDWLNGFHSQERKIYQMRRGLTSEEGDNSSFLAILMPCGWLALIPTASESPASDGAGCFTPNTGAVSLVWVFTSPPAIALTVGRRSEIKSESNQIFHRY